MHSKTESGMPRDGNLFQKRQIKAARLAAAKILGREHKSDQPDEPVSFPTRLGGVRSNSIGVHREFPVRGGGIGLPGVRGVGRGAAYITIRSEELHELLYPSFHSFEQMNASTFVVDGLAPINGIRN